MKLSIFLLLAIVGLFGCASERQPPASSIAPRLPAVPVDFTPGTDKDLQKLGFVLPSSKIKAPDFTLRDLDGAMRSLSSFRGKLVILNFWGVWCYYCRLEMPSLQRLYDRFKAEGLEVVAVDVRDREEEVRAFIKKNRHTFPVLLDEKIAATNEYGIRGFPTTFLMDGEGYLRAMLAGALEWDKQEVTALFKKLLGGKVKPPPGGATVQ